MVAAAKMNAKEHKREAAINLVGFVFSLIPVVNIGAGALMGGRIGATITSNVGEGFNSSKSELAQASPSKKIDKHFRKSSVGFAVGAVVGGLFSPAAAICCGSAVLWHAVRSKFVDKEDSPSDTKEAPKKKTDTASFAERLGNGFREFREAFSGGKKADDKTAGGKEL